MFKCMLASKVTDITKLKFPVLVSKKLDGIRATVQGGQLLSRTLKPIPNVNVQALFKGLPEGTDGELIYGDPCAPDAYRQTVSIVMSDGKLADGIKFYVFDKFANATFEFRIAIAAGIVREYYRDSTDCLVLVEHTRINTTEELEEYEAAALAEGNEGVMVRSLDGPYKQGRSSEKEGYLLKLKRFEDMEATVTDMEEMQRNGNEAFTNELGRTARSSAKDGKSGLGVLGKLNLIGLTGPFTGVAFDCGTGFDAKQREFIWSLGKNINGAIAKIKYFPVGSKDKPRHPVFLGWRDKRDM